MSLLSREQFVNTLEQLLHGDLGIDSTIEQADGALQIPLREHPSYIEPIKVARHISTIQSLRSDFLLDGTPREFDPSLVRVARVFTQLFQEHATGVIVLRGSDQAIEKLENAIKQYGFAIAHLSMAETTLKGLPDAEISPVVEVSAPSIPSRLLW